MCSSTLCDRNILLSGESNLYVPILGQVCDNFRIWNLPANSTIQPGHSNMADLTHWDQKALAAIPIDLARRFYYQVTDSMPPKQP